MDNVATSTWAVLLLIITVASTALLFSLSPLSVAFVSADDREPLLQFVSKQNDGSQSLENTTLMQGEFAIVPIVAMPTFGYEIQAVNLEVRDVPPNVYAWIDWNSYPIFANEGSDRSYVKDYQLKVYVDSNAEPGEYSLTIVGTNGVAKNIATSEDIQIMNETFGTLHVTISPSSSEINFDVGEPEYQMGGLCIDDGSGGQTCSGFVSEEEFPITISSSDGTNGNRIGLTTPDIPEGVWAKFVPTDATESSDVLSGRLKLAGAVRPFTSFPPDTFVLLVEASDGTNSPVTNYLPIIRTNNMTVLHSPEKIGFPFPIAQNVNGTNFTYAGLVYDPYENSSSQSNSLPVSLSIKGIAQQAGGTISPLPDWIKVELPASSFVLNATQPYYFLVKATTHMAPVGSFYLAIDESVGKKDHFTGYLRVDVLESMYGGPASSPVPEFGYLVPLVAAVSIAFVTIAVKFSSNRRT